MALKHQVVVGAAVGLEDLPNLLFDPKEQYTCCLVCGEVFQTEQDRLHLPDLIDELELRAVCTERRRLWSLAHAKSHTPKEHHLLQLSGNWCTPEAAQKLASYGVISVTDLVLSEEHTEAYANSNPIPDADATS